MGEACTFSPLDPEWVRMVSFDSSCCLGTPESRFLSPWKGADPIGPQGAVDRGYGICTFYSFINKRFVLFCVICVCVCEPEYVHHRCECACEDENKVLGPLGPESQ